MISSYFIFHENFHTDSSDFIKKIIKHTENVLEMGEEG